MRKTLAIAALIAAAPLVHAQNDRSVEQLVNTCAACHGQKGDEALQPSYPLLAGQHASYLERSLEQYRSGERRNAVMNGQAANLSDREISALSRYFSQQEGPLYTPTYR